MKPRQEVDVLQDVLGFIKEKPRSSRGIVISTHLNDIMWRKYRIRMIELNLIHEVEVETGNKFFEVTPKGDDLLNLISVFKSVWHSFPPKSGWDKKSFKPWQEMVLKHIWEKGEEGFTCKEAWIRTQEVDRISRTQVSVFLNRIVELGTLNNNQRTGLGGRYGFFTLNVPKLDYDSFSKDVYTRMLKFSGKPSKDMYH